MVDDISDDDLKRWQLSATDDLTSNLKQLNDNFEEHHAFGHLSGDTRRQIREIFCARFNESSKLRQQIVRFLRILARDKNNLQMLLSTALLQNVFGVAFLSTTKQSSSSFAYDWETLIQAEMCLINLLFNSEFARNEFFSESCADLLLARIDRLADTANGDAATPKHAKDDDELTTIALENITLTEKKPTEKSLTEKKPAEKSSSSSPSPPPPATFPVEMLDSEQADLIAFYDLRIAFVASAHLKKLQLQWRKNGCEIFLKLLERSLQFPERLQRNTAADCKFFVERTNWTLKILFNIFCYSQDDYVESSARRCMLLCSGIVTQENVEPTLQQSAIDVIAVIPLSPELLALKIQPETKGKVTAEYDGRDMTFANAVLRALDERLEVGRDGDQTDLLGTFLTVLIHLCIEVKEVRRYLRLRVIPPLHASDVERRPDEGTQLRNRMIRLMMSISNTRDLAAEFIFILCKRSVNRFVKYCGFGHAAGLLANRGILGALNAPRHPSDSEDSETEDYRAVEPQVNPVTGCIEPPREDPFAGMSEEQKEYEAHRLMSDINELMNQGVITPGQIGDDGKLRPVKHVLELVKDNENKPDKSDTESDVD